MDWKLSMNRHCARWGRYNVATNTNLNFAAIFKIFAYNLLLRVPRYLNLTYSVRQNSERRKIFGKLPDCKVINNLLFDVITTFLINKIMRQLVL